MLTQQDNRQSATHLEASYDVNTELDIIVLDQMLKVYGGPWTYQPSGALPLLQVHADPKEAVTHILL